jgi:hypothetical protein
MCLDITPPRFAHGVAIQTPSTASACSIVYLMGGDSSTDSVGWSHDVWRSHEGLEHWEQLSSAPWKSRRSFVTLSLFDNRFAIVGGECVDDTGCPDLWVWTPHQADHMIPHERTNSTGVWDKVVGRNVWGTRSSVPINAASVVLEDRVCLITGTWGCGCVDVSMAVFLLAGMPWVLLVLYRYGNSSPLCTSTASVL